MQLSHVVVAQLKREKCGRDEEERKSGSSYRYTGDHLERVKDSNDRPVLNGRKNVKGISELMEQRREKYEAAADIVINTDDKTVLQICEELVQRLQESEE